MVPTISPCISKATKISLCKMAEKLPKIDSNGTDAKLKLVSEIFNQVSTDKDKNLKYQ